MSRLLAYLLLGLILFVGYQWWSKQQAAPLSAPQPAAAPAPSANIQLSANLSAPSAQPIVRQGGGSHIMMPVKLEGAYAAALNEIQQLIQLGKDHDAEAKLQTLPADALNDPAVRTATATLWNNLGVTRVKGSGAASGVSAYKTAVSINPYDRVANHNLIHAYWELHDPALTRELLEESIKLAPENPLPHLALAELLINKDDLASAATHLQETKDRVAEFPNLQSYLAQLLARVEKTQQAEQKFLARESSHFTVKFDGGDDHTVWSRVSEILEDAYREIGQQLDAYPSKPILVVLHTQETFHDATGGPAWSDGLYDPLLGRIKVPTKGALTDQAWLTRVLRHEFVHALLHDRMKGRTIPQWLNEGLAMQLAGDPPPDIPELVRGQVTLANLTQLEGNWSGLNPRQANVAYLEGNSATKYFIDRFGMEKVREVLGQLANGQTMAAAVQDRLFITYEQFQQRWIDELNEKIKAGRS
jgi:Tfp pilus assembly protein PilF